MLGIVCQIGLLQLTVRTLSNAGWIDIGRTRKLSTTFVHNYKEPEVEVNVDILNKHYNDYVKCKMRRA